MQLNKNILQFQYKIITLTIHARSDISLWLSMKMLSFCNITCSNSAHRNQHEDYCLQRYNTVYSVESQPTFLKNIAPPSSGSNKPITIPLWKQVASSSNLLVPALHWYFNPEPSSQNSSYDKNVYSFVFRAEFTS